MQVGIQVVKRTLFRGVQQEFSNQYHYRLDSAVTAPAEALLDAVVAIERDFHSTDVTFVRGSVWSSGGSPSNNQMLFQKNLTGTGNQVTQSTQDKERAFLFRWKAGFDSRGRQVYLRKWFHAAGAAAGVAPGNPVLQQTGGFSGADLTTLGTSANRLREIHADLWKLCGPTGRFTTAAAESHPYLEHHQLGEMWR